MGTSGYLIPQHTTFHSETCIVLIILLRQSVLLYDIQMAWWHAHSLSKQIESESRSAVVSQIAGCCP